MSVPVRVIHHTGQDNKSQNISNVCVKCFENVKTFLTSGTPSRLKQTLKVILKSSLTHVCCPTAFILCQCKKTICILFFIDMFSYHGNWSETWGGARREVCVFLIPVKKCARIDFQDLFEY